MAGSRKCNCMYLFAVVAAVIISGLFRYSSIENELYNINSSMIDGVLVWAADKFLIIGIIPMIIIIYNNLVKNSEYSSSIVVKYNNRLRLWLRQECRILFICMGTMVFVMLFSGLLAYILNDGRMYMDFNETDTWSYTYIGRTLKLQGVDSGIYINYVTCVVVAFVINSLEMFLIVLVSNVFEWISGSVMISVIISFAFCIMVGVNPQAGYGYSLGFLDIKVQPGDFYYELINPQVAFTRALIILLLVGLINILAVPFVKRRNFVKRGDLG